MQLPYSQKEQLAHDLIRSGEQYIKRGKDMIDELAEEPEGKEE